MKQYWYAAMMLMCLQPAWAQAPGSGSISRLGQEVLARLEALHKDAAAQKSAIKAGREQATFCAYCHGPDGNSEKPDIPNLASQDPVYLLDQIGRFASGQRQDYTGVMQQLSKRFSDEEKMALVVYYASVPLKRRPGRGGSPDAAALYEARCRQCHGAAGREKSGYAHIAGQQTVYVEKVLKAFRDKSAERLNPVMTGMVQDLSDEQITDLAAYIGGL